MPRLAGVRVCAAPAAVPGRLALYILVLDDNRDAADSLAALLRLLGHEVRVAYDGNHTLALASIRPPRVVFLDLSMPRLDGYTLARELRQLPQMRAATLICLSGLTEEAVRRRAKDAGFDHHLAKPANPTEIDRILRHIEANNVKESAKPPEGAAGISP
jgi:CheY-like chemotaxis protein